MNSHLKIDNTIELETLYKTKKFSPNESQREAIQCMDRPLF